MENIMVIWEALIPLFFMYYGYKLKKHPPKMGEKGLGTKLAMQSQAAWDMANAYGSKLCLIMGACLLVIYIIRLIVFGFQMSTTYSLILIVLELICIISLLPLINRKIKKTYGKK